MDPSRRIIFDGYQARLTARLAPALIDALDDAMMPLQGGPGSLICDIGGGEGAMLMTVSGSIAGGRRERCWMTILSHSMLYIYRSIQHTYTDAFPLSWIKRYRCRSTREY